MNSYQKFINQNIHRRWLRYTDFNSNLCPEEPLILASSLSMRQINQAFRKFCEVGALDTIKALVTEFGSDIDIAGGHNHAVRMACQHNRLDLLEFLHDNYKDRIDIEALNNYALRVSCKHDYYQIVKYLLDNWADSVNITDIAYSAFRHCCRRNHYDIAQMLYDHGSAFWNWHIILGTGTALTDIFRREEKWTNFVSSIVSSPQLENTGWYTLVSMSYFMARDKRLGLLDTFIKGVDEKHKHDLINRLLENSTRYNHNIISQKLLGDYADTISDKTVNNILREGNHHCCKLVSNMRKRVTIDDVLDLVLDMCPHLISPATFDTVLFNVCTSGCNRALRRLVGDFRDRFSDAICNKALVEMCKGYVIQTKNNCIRSGNIVHVKTFFTTFISSFKDRFSQESCREAYANLSQFDRYLIRDCLAAHLGEKCLD